MKNNIKAILFDMGGVLLYKKKDYIPISEKEINALKIEELYNDVDDEKLIRDLKEVGLSLEQINEALPYIPAMYEKFDKLWNLLPDLKKKHKLAVINNGNALAEKYWKERFDFSIFDTFTISANEGVRKPDPEIFLITCKKLGVEPEDCLFLDDVEENILGAKKLGMKVILWDKYNREESFREFTFFIDKL